MSIPRTDMHVLVHAHVSAVNQYATAFGYDVAAVVGFVTISNDALSSHVQLAILTRLDLIANSGPATTVLALRVNSVLVTVLVWLLVSIFSVL